MAVEAAGNNLTIDLTAELACVLVSTVRIVDRLNDREPIVDRDVARAVFTF